MHVETTAVALAGVDGIGGCYLSAKLVTPDGSMDVKDEKVRGETPGSDRMPQVPHAREQTNAAFGNPFPPCYLRVCTLSNNSALGISPLFCCCSCCLPFASKAHRRVRAQVPADDRGDAHHEAAAEA